MRKRIAYQLDHRWMDGLHSRMQSNCDSTPISQWKTFCPTGVFYGLRQFWHFAHSLQSDIYLNGHQFDDLMYLESFIRYLEHVRTISECGLLHILAEFCLLLKLLFDLTCQSLQMCPRPSQKWMSIFRSLSIPFLSKLVHEFAELKTNFHLKYGQFLYSVNFLRRSCHLSNIVRALHVFCLIVRLFDFCFPLIEREPRRSCFLEAATYCSFIKMEMHGAGIFGERQWASFMNAVIKVVSRIHGNKFACWR